MKRIRLIIISICCVSIVMAGVLLWKLLVQQKNRNDEQRAVIEENQEMTSEIRDTEILSSPDGSEEVEIEKNSGIEEFATEAPLLTDPAYELHQKKVICIDAGHQRHQNSEPEAIGPGATETKMKVTSGTSGCVSGLSEYQLNLQVAKKLKKALKKAGYQVIMTRESNDVDISNKERADIANKAKADAFIRIHADGSENSTEQGAMTICSTAHTPYYPKNYKKSKKLAKCILDGVVKETGCKSRSIWETDSMSGINWCKVPVTILEMGYMSNPEEDKLMATEKYQKKIVQGIVKGVNKFVR